MEIYLIKLSGGYTGYMVNIWLRGGGGINYFVYLSMHYPHTQSPMKTLWLKKNVVKGREEIVWEHYTIHRKTSPGTL